MPRLTEEQGGKVKPSKFQHEYTQEQALEIIRCSKDPVYFIKKYVMVQHPTKGALPFILRDYQEDLINVYHEHRRSVNLLGRQSGKTACASAFLLWWAIFKKHQTILIASKDHTGAKEIMKRLWYAYEELPWWIKPGVITDQVHSKTFDNGSEIVALATTETTGRGMSISVLYVDEFAFVKPGCCC